MKGVLIVSLDFELFWGMYGNAGFDNYKANILGARNAIPLLLQLFNKYGIHATWAAVGFLFAENYEELSRFFPELKPSYENQQFYTYSVFEAIGNNEKEEPCYYAGSIIKMISETKGQEIGSHTFSHYYCTEKGQTIEQFDADLKAARRIAEDKGYKITSIVYPKNLIEDKYIRCAAENGFTAYRDIENDFINKKLIKYWTLMRALRLLDVYIPITGSGTYLPSVQNGIVKLQGSRMYKPLRHSLRWLEGLKVRRIKKQMLYAAKHNEVFHLWWHPHNIGTDTEYHLKQLEDIFKYYKELKDKYGMVSLNMNEVSEAVLGK